MSRPRTRTLSDSEARWEAINLIAAATTDYINGGAVVARGEREGWTEQDMLAVEQHVQDRVDALIRRPRRA